MLQAILTDFVRDRCAVKNRKAASTSKLTITPGLKEKAIQVQKGNPIFLTISKANTLLNSTLNKRTFHISLHLLKQMHSWPTLQEQT